MGLHPGYKIKLDMGFKSPIAALFFEEARVFRNDGSAQGGQSMIVAPKLKNREAIDEQNGEKPRRLIVPIPKTEPPLEESFVFPAEKWWGEAPCR